MHLHQLVPRQLLRVVNEAYIKIYVRRDLGENSTKKGGALSLLLSNFSLESGVTTVQEN